MMNMAWTDDNIFNFEGGCYAKCINLTEEKEPEIFHAIRHGALVENTKFYPGTNKINFEDASITENTRVSYPLNFISNAHGAIHRRFAKKYFLFNLRCFWCVASDIKITPGQAMYQFIVVIQQKWPEQKPELQNQSQLSVLVSEHLFFHLHPGKYAMMLGKKMQENKVNVWLINTGWTGGTYGVGNRMKLSYTRAMITAALEGKLDNVEFENHRSIWNGDA